MDYIKIERTLKALMHAVTAAKANWEHSDENGYAKAVSAINIEFERLRDLLGY